MEKCVLCGARTKQKRAELPIPVAGKLVVVRGVPARVCDQCGEVYYTLKTARALEEVESRVERGDARLLPLRNAYEIPLAEV